MTPLWHHRDATRNHYGITAQVVASAVAQPLAFTPGTEQRYNGVNYFLTGLIIEKVSGHSYDKELDRRIVRPLGLRATSLPAPGDTGIAGPHAHGYVTVAGRLLPRAQLAPMLTLPDVPYTD